MFEHLDKRGFRLCVKLVMRCWAPRICFFATYSAKGEILNVLGRYDEAKAVYQQVLDNATITWARDSNFRAVWMSSLKPN